MGVFAIYQCSRQHNFLVMNRLDMMKQGFLPIFAGCINNKYLSKMENALIYLYGSKVIENTNKKSIVIINILLVAFSN